MLKEACRLVGEYAAWFGKAQVLAGAVAQAARAPGAPPDLAAAAAALAAEAPVDAALRLALAALAARGGWAAGAGAQAFRNVCVRCAARLGTAEVLPGELCGTWRCGVGGRALRWNGAGGAYQRCECDEVARAGRRAARVA